MKSTSLDLSGFANSAADFFETFRRISLFMSVQRGIALVLLLSIGCTKFQGYYFSRPLSGEIFLEFINKSDCLQGFNKLDD